MTARRIRIPLVTDANGKIVYPDPPVLTAQADGPPLLTSNWGQTWTEGGDLVGFYSGTDPAVLDDPTPKSPPTDAFATAFDSRQLLDAFTSTEALAAIAAGGAIADQITLLSIRTKPIHVTDAGYQAAIAALEAAGVLSAERAAVFRQGLPR